MRESARSIGPELFQFYRELKENNTRVWFAQNRSRYDGHVKEPLLDLIRNFRVPLHSVSPHYCAIPKAGASLFRPHRDTRFTKNKMPFKLAAGVRFRHEAGRIAHPPIFYLHLEPGEVFAAIGIWKPDTATLRMIRQAIVDDPDEWQRVIETPEFVAHFDRDSYKDSLKRAPKGFDPNHPFIEDLRRKHFTASTRLSEEQVCQQDFVVSLAATFRHGAVFMEYLTRALGLPW